MSVASADQHRSLLRAVAVLWVSYGRTMVRFVSYNHKVNTMMQLPENRNAFAQMNRRTLVLSSFGHRFRPSLRPRIQELRKATALGPPLCCRISSSKCWRQSRVWCDGDFRCCKELYWHTRTCFRMLVTHLAEFGRYGHSSSRPSKAVESEGVCAGSSRSLLRTDPRYKTFLSVTKSMCTAVSMLQVSKVW